MENNNQIQSLETQEGRVLLCPSPCNGAVCISRTRYDELVRAEMEREILFHAYQLRDGFSMDPVMDAIFNPKFKYRSGADADNKAGVGNAE